MTFNIARKKIAGTIVNALNAIPLFCLHSLKGWLAMMTTLEMFDQVKHAHKLRTDGALARMLGVTPGLICKHRKRSFAMENETALRVAELLNLDPAQVLLMVSVERAKCPQEKAAFMRLMAWAQFNAKGLAASVAEFENFTAGAFAPSKSFAQ